MSRIKVEELDWRTQAIFKHYQRFTLEGLASYHQGVVCKFGRYAGMQCLSNCTAYLMYSYYNRGAPLKDTMELDYILYIGSKIDFVLRQGGSIAPNRYVQIQEIPATVVTSHVQCHVYQSQEIFGLLNKDAPLVHDDVMSLRRLLTRNYNNVTQYFICICNAMATAIVIKDSKYYLFNPHCFPGIANTVAHVISTSNADDLVEYVGPKEAEYTGAFLYFVPSDVPLANHAAYVANNYKVLMFSQPNRVQVDVSEADKNQSFIRELPVNSKSEAPHVGDGAVPLESKRAPSAEPASQEKGQKLVKEKHKKGYAPYSKSKPVAKPKVEDAAESGDSPQRRRSPKDHLSTTHTNDLFEDQQRKGGYAQGGDGKGRLGRDRDGRATQDLDSVRDHASRQQPNQDVDLDLNPNLDTISSNESSGSNKQSDPRYPPKTPVVGNVTSSNEKLPPPTTGALDEKTQNKIKEKNPEGKWSGANGAAPKGKSLDSRRQPLSADTPARGDDEGEGEDFSQAASPAGPRVPARVHSPHAQRPPTGTDTPAGGDEDDDSMLLDEGAGTEPSANSPGHKCVNDEDASLPHRYSGELAGEHPRREETQPGRDNSAQTPMRDDGGYSDENVPPPGLRTRAETLDGTSIGATAKGERNPSDDNNNKNYTATLNDEGGREGSPRKDDMEREEAASDEEAWDSDGWSSSSDIEDDDEDDEELSDALPGGTRTARAKNSMYSECLTRGARPPPEQPFSSVFQEKGERGEEEPMVTAEAEPLGGQDGRGGGSQSSNESSGSEKRPAENDRPWDEDENPAAEGAGGRRTKKLKTEGLDKSGRDTGTPASTPGPVFGSRSDREPSQGPGEPMEKKEEAADTDDEGGREVYGESHWAGNFGTGRSNEADTLPRPVTKASAREESAGGRRRGGAAATREGRDSRGQQSSGYTDATKKSIVQSSCSSHESDDSLLLSLDDDDDSVFREEDIAPRDDKQDPGNLGLDRVPGVPGSCTPSYDDNISREGGGAGGTSVTDKEHGCTTTDVSRDSAVPHLCSPSIGKQEKVKESLEQGPADGAPVSALPWAEDGLSTTTDVRPPHGNRRTADPPLCENEEEEAPTPPPLLLAMPPAAVATSAAEDMLTEMASLKRKRRPLTTASDSDTDSGAEDYLSHHSKTAHWEGGAVNHDDIWLDDDPGAVSSPDSLGGGGRLFSSSEESLDTIGEGGGGGVGSSDDDEGEEGGDDGGGGGEELPEVPADVDFSPVDTFINNMRGFAHSENLPLIVDKSILRGYREANALHAIDKMVTNIVIEHGVVTGSEHSSRAKNLLKFIVLWGRKLHIPTKDLEAFMATNLEISNLCSAIDDGTFPEGLFLSHVLTKVNKCLPTIYAHTRGDVPKIVSILNSETQKMESREEAVDLRGYAGILTGVFDRHGYIISTKSESVEIVEKIGALRRAAAARNNEIASEENLFASLVRALETFGPAPDAPRVIESQSKIKNQIFQEAVGSTVAAVTERVRTLTTDFMDSLAAGHMDTTYMPDIDSLLANIDSTIRLLGFAADKLQMEKKPLRAAAQQLAYMGGELASMANADWPHRPAEPVTPLKEFGELRGRLIELQKEDENARATDRILGDVERMLDDITTSSGGDGGGAVSQTLTIPMLENYIKNAGTLIGEAHNERYLKLKARLKELASSEEFLVNTIHTATLYSLSHTLAKIEDILASSPNLKNSEKVLKAFAGTSEVLIGDAVDAASARDPARLDLGAMASLARFLKHSATPGGEDAGAALYAVAEAVKMEKEAKGRDRWRAIEGKLGDAHTRVARSAIAGSVKKKLFGLLQNLRKAYAAREEEELMEEWKTHVARAPIASMEDVNDILRAAPNKEAEEYAAKKLEERVKEIREAEAKRSKEAEDLLARAIKKRGLHSWGKIQNAFDNRAFEGLAGEDWAAVAAEYHREGSTLSSALPAQLSKLTEAVEADAREIFGNKVASMLPNGPAFEPPAYDWLTPYRQNANFYLKNFPVPGMDRRAEEIEAQINYIKQALEGADVREATANTPLERPTAQTLELVERLKEGATDVKNHIDAGEGSYLRELEKRGPEGELPPRPKMEVPKKLLTYEQSLALADLPENFQKNVLRNETLLLNRLGEHLTKVNEAMASLESQIKTSKADVNARLAAAIKEQLPQASAAIAARRLDPGDPVGFLEGIVRDGHIVNSEPYATTRESLEWLRRAYKAVLPLAPISLKRRLELLDEEISREMGRATKALDLERRANETDDVGVLTEAIDTLEAKRVTGGKATVEGWVKKRDAFKKMVDDLAARAEVEKKLRPLVDKARETLDATELASLGRDAADLLKEAEAGGLDKTSPETRDAVLELRAYLGFKLDLLRHYLDSQKPVFAAAPPSRSLSPSNKRGDDEPQLRLAPRLAICKSLARQQTAKLPSRWLATRPKVDPATETLLPGEGQGAPIHLRPVFENFLEPLLFLPEKHPRVKPGVGEGRGPLYGTNSKRLGVELRDLFSNQWEDVVAHAQEVLTAYAANRIEGAAVRENAFFSMVLFAHAVHVTTGERAARRDRDSEVLPVTHAQWTQLLLAMWPELAASCTHAPSLRQAVNNLRDTVPSLRLLTPALFLADMYFPVKRHRLKHLRGFPAPRAFLMRPERWPVADVASALWGSAGFSLLFPKDELNRARVGFLLWALLTVDEVVLAQLWNTLPPLGRGLKSPLHLLYAVAAVEYPNTVPEVEVESGGGGGIRAPYPYGRLTGDSYSLGPSETTKAASVPVTGFEVAVGCLLCDVYAHIFINSEKPWMADAPGGRGRIDLVSPLLDCTGKVEPFKSLKGVPRKTVEPSAGLLGGLASPEEVHLFERQAAWLEKKKTKGGAGGAEGEPSDRFIVVLNPNNYLQGAYLGNAEPSRDAAPLELVIEESKTWPRGALAVDSSYDPVPDSEAVQRYEALTAPYKNVTLNQVFAQFPGSIRDAPGPLSDEGESSGEDSLQEGSEGEGDEDETAEAVGSEEELEGREGKTGYDSYQPRAPTRGRQDADSILPTTPTPRKRDEGGQDGDGVRPYFHAKGARDSALLGNVPTVGPGQEESGGASSSKAKSRPKVRLRQPKAAAATRVAGSQEEVGFSPGRAPAPGSSVAKATSSPIFQGEPKDSVGAGSQKRRRRRQQQEALQQPKVSGKTQAAPGASEAAAEAPCQKTPEPKSIPKTSKESCCPPPARPLPPSNISLKGLFGGAEASGHGPLSPGFPVEDEPEQKLIPKTSKGEEGPPLTSRRPGSAEDDQPVTGPAAEKPSAPQAPPPSWSQKGEREPLLKRPTKVPGAAPRDTSARAPRGRAPQPPPDKERGPSEKRGEGDKADSTKGAPATGRVKVKLYQRGEISDWDLKPQEAGPSPSSPDRESPSGGQRLPERPAVSVAKPKSQAPRASLAQRPSPTATAEAAKPKHEQKQKSQFETPAQQQPQAAAAAAAAAAASGPSLKQPPTAPAPHLPPDAKKQSAPPPKINLNLDSKTKKHQPVSHRAREGAASGAPSPLLSPVTQAPPPPPPPSPPHSPYQQTLHHSLFDDSDDDVFETATEQSFGDQRLSDHLPPTSGLHSGRPSVSHEPISIDHILRGRYPLSQTTSLEDSLDDAPVQELYLHEERVTESKHALLRLIASIRTRVVQTTRMILNKIQQIQALYL
nr:large tegument protein [Equid gammaherpesvirus 5]